MRVLIAGAAGYVGSHVARALTERGHSVVALARSAERADAFAALGYRTYRGSLADMVAAADDVEGVVFAAAVPFPAETPAVVSVLAHLAGTQKPFILTSGTAVLSLETPNGEWREETFAEDDLFTPPDWIRIRVETEMTVRRAANAGVRAMVVRPPLIWGHGGSKQVPAIFDSIGASGAACYIGQGLNLYSNVHVDDLADLYCLALEKGTPGALYHAVAGETCFRSLAEAAADVMGCGTRSVTLAESRKIWGEFLGPLFFGVSSRSRAPRARNELGWQPKHLDIVGDIVAGSYRKAYRS
jgi:nucleoside-diphosphate-sugar epimerase